MDCCEKPSPVFPLDKFLAEFPEFNNAEIYPVPLVQRCGTRAMLHVGPESFFMPMKGHSRCYALFLMAAHLIVLAKQDYDSVSEGGAGSPGGSEIKATIGSVSIERTKPNSFTVDDWSYWLNETPYGRELLAYLDLQAPAGIFLNTARDSVRDLI